MWQALLVLLVIILAAALAKGRAGTPFRHHAPWVGSCDHLRRKMETKNSDDNKLKWHLNFQRKNFFAKSAIFCLPKPKLLPIKSRSSRHGEVSELVEGARLEIVCTLKAYQEFESLPLRHRENSPLRNQRVFSFMPDYWHPPPSALSWRWFCYTPPRWIHQNPSLVSLLMTGLLSFPYYGKRLSHHHKSSLSAPAAW